MKIPCMIEEVTKDLKYEIDEVGKSGDTLLVYEDKYILKISTNIESLKREYEKNKWLCEHLPSPKPILFIIEDNKAYYLREYIKGKSLIEKEFISNPELLTDLIVEAFKYLRKLDNEECPFKSNDNEGNSFVHGDLCLPNILVNNGKISGFIDLDNSGLGDIYYDYTWIIWSLMRNLKTDRYNEVLLKKLGITFNKNKFDLYIPDELKEIIKKDFKY